MKRTAASAGSHALARAPLPGSHASTTAPEPRSHASSTAPEPGSHASTTAPGPRSRASTTVSAPPGVSAAASTPASPRILATDAVRVPVAPIALASAAALVARLLTGPRPTDDAFITLRYARNLAEGLGLVYNPGELVLGTTTPVWAVVLALGDRLGGHDLPLLASSLAAVCDAFMAGLLVILAVRMGWSGFAALLVGLAWAINPMSIAFASGGMETSLFVLAALGALTLAAHRRLTAAALIAGVATFVRPEGILVGLAVLGWAWWIRRRALAEAVGGFAAPLAVGAAGLWLAYGSPVPSSIAAKQIAYAPPWPGENLAALVLQAAMPAGSLYLLGALPAAGALLLAALGLGSLAFLARATVASYGLPHVHPLRRPQRTYEASREPSQQDAEASREPSGECHNFGGVAWQPFAVFGALYLLFYAAAGLRGVRLFPWYLVPLEPLYLLGAAAALRHVSLRIGRWLPVVLVLWQLPAIDWRQPVLPVGYSLEREQVLLSVGRELGASLATTAVVAAPEIGALGYASRLRILDTVGLVSPAAWAYYPLPADQLVTDNAVPASLIADARPDAVVALDAFVERTLLVDPAFQRDYRLEQAYPVDVWHSTRVLVFRRVDAAQAR